MNGLEKMIDARLAIFQSRRATKFGAARQRLLAGLFGGPTQEWEVISEAMNAYRVNVPYEQFCRELLESNYWGSASIIQASYALRSVSLELRKEVDALTKSMTAH